MAQNYSSVPTSFSMASLLLLVMVTPKRVRITSNISAPRTETDIEGTPRTLRYSSGKELEVGKDVSKERAEWLISKKYGIDAGAKGLVSDVDAVGYGADEDVKKATREASEQFGASNSQVDAQTEVYDDEPTGAGKKSAKKSAK